MTDGTASETGHASVITGTDQPKKTVKTGFHPQMPSPLMICDPKPIVALPRTVTANSGLGHFAHTVEAVKKPHCHSANEDVRLKTFGSWSRPCPALASTAATSRRAPTS